MPNSDTLTQASIQAIFKNSNTGRVNRLTSDSKETIDDIVATSIAAFGNFFRKQKGAAKTNAKTIQGNDVLAAVTHVFALGDLANNARAAAKNAMSTYYKGGSSKGTAKNTRAGLNVNPTLAKRLLKANLPYKVSEGAGVALAAALEYVLTEVFEIASRQSSNLTISRDEIINALNVDSDLRSQFPKLMFKEDKKHLDAAKAGLSLKQPCHISVGHGITGSQLKFFQNKAGIDSAAGDVKKATGKLVENFVKVVAVSAKASMEAAGRTTVLDIDVITSCDNGHISGGAKTKGSKKGSSKKRPSADAPPAFKATVAHCVNHCLGKKKGSSIKVSEKAYQKIADAAQVYVESVFAKAANLSNARKVAKGSAKSKLTIVDLAAAQEMVGCNVGPICGKTVEDATQVDAPPAVVAPPPAAARPPSSSKSKKKSSKSKAKSAKAKKPAAKKPASKKPASVKAKKPAKAAPASPVRRSARSRKAPARLGQA